MPSKKCEERARLEEYLEEIYRLSLEDRPRIRTLARRLGVKPSTVVAFLRKLEKEGYLIYEKGGIIFLTEKGKEIAKSIYERHMVIKNFLLVIGVPEEIADEDACLIEHYLHPESVKKLQEFVANYLNTSKKIM